MTRTVGISISECEDMGLHGMGLVHLQDAMVEVARMLLSKGHVLAYGGDLNYSGPFNFTELLFQLAQTYGGANRRVINYSAFPLYLKISVRREAELVRVAEIRRVTAAEYAGWEDRRYDDLSAEGKQEIEEIFKASTPSHRKLWEDVLTAMREKMTREIQCRIVMGGKLQGFKGKMAGVIEETILCVANDVTVFIDGRMGGAALELANGLKDRKASASGFDFSAVPGSKVVELKKNVVMFRGKEAFPDLEKYFNIF